MSSDDRPNPEELLRAINREETSRNKGRLKIFLGMAAGVGKTFAMLKEAQNLVQDGKDVVVGIIDTHGREETAALLSGLKIIPNRTLLYRDKEFQEFDLDAALKLRPKLILVDELAHTNIPGSRHSKRWQDVVELLDKGINVYTTLNVQHIESLNDVVANITEVLVKETVPDLILETASSIQLIDLTPDELLHRLKEGKVYLGDQSQIAARHFFQKDRLTALREIVLRFAAEKVDRDLKDLVPSAERIINWKPREKLLVAVGPSPHSQKLIRTTRRLAFNLDAPWIAVHVDDGKFLSESDNNMLAKNLALARDLGAEVVTTNDPNVAEGLQRVARQRGATQIIVGRPPKTWYEGLFTNTLPDKLAKECRDIDIHIIREEGHKVRYRKPFFHFTSKFTSYLLVMFYVFLFAGFCATALSNVSYRIIGVLFLLGILVLSLFFKKGPVFFAAVLYAFIWDYFFLQPYGSLYIYTNEDMASLILFFLTAIVTGILVDRAREHKEMLAKREDTVQALYEIVRQIAIAPTRSELLNNIRDRLGKIFNGSFEILTKQIDGSLDLQNSLLLTDDKEIGAAVWSFENEKESGWSTTTLPMSKNLIIPLKGYHEVVGLIIYRPKMNRTLTTEEINFLYTVGQQLANYLERRLSQTRKSQEDQHKLEERIYQTVLKSISSQLRNPLSSIQSAVFETVESLKADSKTKIVEGQIHKIKDSSEGLSNILDNVSAMAKLSGSIIPTQSILNNVEKLITTCCNNLGSRIGERRLSIKIQENLPLIPFDFSLLEILLRNLITNAIEYSPSTSTIEIEAKKLDNIFELSVADEGKGVPPDQQDSIFEKFYQVPGTATTGMGLGLAIAKKIAEIHNGELKVENRPDKGAKFTLRLVCKGENELNESSQ